MSHKWEQIIDSKEKPMVIGWKCLNCGATTGRSNWSPREEAPDDKWVEHFFGLECPKNGNI